MDGFTFDHTGHLLHLHNEYTRKLIRRLLPGNLRECARNAWIFSNGVYTRYPFQANLYGLPSKIVDECYLGLWEARRKYGDDPLRTNHRLTFAEWSERLFGKGISEHFMFPYNRKLWTVPPDTLTPDWCGQFVPQPRLQDVLVGAVTDRSTAFGYNVSFLYPHRGGIQVLSEAFAQKIGNVRLGCSLEKLLWQEKKAVLSSGEMLPYAHLVSTIPLPELLKRLSPFPRELGEAAGQLRWTSVLCVNLGVNRRNISDKSWIYFPEDKFPFYRVGFPMNFSPQTVPDGCSSMYVEISSPPEKMPASPNSRNALLRRIREGLIACNVLKRSDTFPVVSYLPIPYAYVIYDQRRRSALETIQPWLRARANTHSIGRYGAWKYSFMEEAILDGKELAETLQKSSAAV